MPGARAQSGRERLGTKLFDRVRKLAYDEFGLSMSEHKRELVAARLGKKARENHCESLEEYFEKVLADRSGAGLTALIDALTTNHTSFLREPAHYDFLREVLRRQTWPAGSPRIWCAASSTGEEPYSLVMTLLDEFGDPPAIDFSILATDISTKALHLAERGVYTGDRVSNLPDTWRKKFCQRGRGRWEGTIRMSPSVRSRVRYDRYNLVHPTSDPGVFPFIFCRNVMIYFDKKTQEGVVRRLTKQLAPGGYLFIGHAESLMGSQHSLAYVRPSVYRRPEKS